jgi:glycerol-3-phosphate acyltransferase PlsY
VLLDVALVVNIILILLVATIYLPAASRRFPALQSTSLRTAACFLVVLVIQLNAGPRSLPYALWLFVVVFAAFATIVGTMLTVRELRNVRRWGRGTNGPRRAGR